MNTNKAYFRAGIFASNNLLATGLAAIAGIVQSRWVSPEVLGEFRQYFILSTYFYIPLVFVHDGFMRKFPMLIGTGQIEEAHELASTVKWWYTRTTFVFCLIFVVLSAQSALGGNMRAAVGWFVQIFVVTRNIYGTYLSTLFRSNKEFVRLSQIKLVSDSSLFVGLLFVYLFGFFGLAIKISIGSLVTFGLQQKYVPVKVRAKRNWKALLDNAKISLPLSIPGYLNTSFLTASILSLVLLSNDKEALGMFSFAMFIFGFGRMMVNSFNQILNVKLLTAWGKAESSLRTLKMLRKPVLLTFLASCLFYAIAFIFIEPIVTFVTPKYAGAVPAVRILLLRVPILALCAPFGIFKSGLWYREYYTTAIIQFVGTIVLVYLMRGSLNTICIALVMATAIHVMTGYLVLIRRMIREQKEILKH